MSAAAHLRTAAAAARGASAELARVEAALAQLPPLPSADAAPESLALAAARARLEDARAAAAIDDAAPGEVD
ncbi:MAG: NADH-quinone oxidoreductase subunit C, partial [Pseudomonadota bacterium]